MTKIKSLATILTTGLLAAFSALLAAAPAGASVSPTAAVTSNGEAGYYAGMNAPGHFTTVRTRFFLRVAAEGTGANGGEGIQLCNDSTGNAVQLGVRWNGTGFQVLVASGTLSASSPGTHATPCNSGGAMSGSPLSPDLVIPQGHTVKLQLTEVHPGFYEAFAKDVTDNFSVSKSFSGLSFPDEASAGVVQDNTSRSAPANIMLVRFRNTRAVDSHGVSSYLGGTSEWTAVKAFDTANGLVSDPALVVPGPLAAGHFVVNEGGEVS